MVPVHLGRARAQVRNLRRMISDAAAVKPDTLPRMSRGRILRPGFERTDSDGKWLLKSMQQSQLLEFLAERVDSVKPFHYKQLWSWLFRSLEHNFNRMHTLPVDLRSILLERSRADELSLARVADAGDGVRKMVFRLDGGSEIESVVIPSVHSHKSRTRHTLCISSQVGCAMNCQFCFTAKMGLWQHLSAGEIVDQVVQAQRWLREGGEEPVTNVVFMGMGEPLHNPDNVIQATKILTDRQGLHLSPRKITVSTSGLIPEMRRYLRETDTNLAVSLNATTEEVQCNDGIFMVIHVYLLDLQVRNRIMPINRKHSLANLIGALEEELNTEARSKSKVLTLFCLLPIHII